MTRRNIAIAVGVVVVLVAGLAFAATRDDGSPKKQAKGQVRAVDTPEPSTTSTSTAGDTTTTTGASHGPATAATSAPRSQATGTVTPAAAGAPIVFARNSEKAFEVWMMNADGSGQRRIDTFPQPDPSPPECGATWPIAHTLGDWSPDATRFFVLSACPGTDAIVYDRSGRRLQRFRVSDASGAVDAAWSSDGTQLAADAEGNNPVLTITDVATGRVVRRFEGFASHYIGWAPSSRIAMMGIKFPERVAGLFTADPVTGSWRRVAPAVFQGRPQWSSDGRILFRYEPEKQYDPSDPSTYVTMGIVHDVADAPVTRLCGDAGDFGWSPDYHSVVGAILDHQGGAEVRVCPSDGGPATADLGAGVNPSFDSQGRVVYSADGNTWIVNADGSGRRRLAAGGPAKPAPR